MANLKPGWKRVKFGEVVRLNKETCKDPVAAGIERVIGLEHLEPGDLRIRSWADVAEGTTFTNRVRPGQVLFGKRRAYQRKVAVADSDAICSGDIYVFESANPERLLPELLPFLCQTDAFVEHAVGTSAGSLSPRTNWSSLAEYEFALPPLEEQRRIVRTLDASTALSYSHDTLTRMLDSVIESFLEDSLSRAISTSHAQIGEVCDDVTVGIVVNPSSFYDTGGVLAISHSNIERGFIDPAGAQRLSKAGHEQHRKSWLEAGNVVLPRVSTLQGRPYYAAVVGDELHQTNAIGVLILRPSSRITPWYLSAALNAPTMRRRLVGASVGSIQRQLNVGVIRGVAIGVPALIDQHAVGERFKALLVSHQAAQRVRARAHSEVCRLRNNLLKGPQ
jgi:type I restriction enzyme S subunit